jgi:hypothetical protein
MSHNTQYIDLLNNIQHVTLSAQIFLVNKLVCLGKNVGNAIPVQAVEALRVARG